MLEGIQLRLLVLLEGRQERIEFRRQTSECLRKWKASELVRNSRLAGARETAQQLWQHAEHA